MSLAFQPSTLSSFSQTGTWEHWVVIRFTKGSFFSLFLFLTASFLLLFTLMGKEVAARLLAGLVKKTLSSLWLWEKRGRPDGIFHYFRASKSCDWRTLRSTDTSIHGFWGSNIAKRSVGETDCFSAMADRLQMLGIRIVVLLRKHTWPDWHFFLIDDVISKYR